MSKLTEGMGAAGKGFRAPPRQAVAPPPEGSGGEQANTLICSRCGTVHLFLGAPPRACSQCWAMMSAGDESEISGAGIPDKEVVSRPNTDKAIFAAPAGKFVSDFMDRGGIVDVDQVAETFGMSKGQLAATTGLATATLSKADRRTGVRAQGRVTEMLEIISRIKEWAGGDAQAMAWYRSQPIPALDGRTSEALVKSGRAAAVRDYLDHLALGGFA